MAADVPLWQYLVSSVAVPILVGLVGAWIGYKLSLRRTRVETRMLERRVTYAELALALSDLAEYDLRALRLLYGEFRSQAAVDHEHEQDDSWELRRAAALKVVRSILARGQLAASKPILEALQSFMDERKRTSDSMHPEDFADGLEMMAEISGKAYKTVSTLAASEVQ